MCGMPFIIIHTIDPYSEALTKINTDLHTPENGYFLDTCLPLVLLGLFGS